MQENSIPGGLVISKGWLRKKLLLWLMHNNNYYSNTNIYV